jgi:hypothetical protein
MICGFLQREGIPLPLVDDLQDRVLVPCFVLRHGGRPLIDDEVRDGAESLFTGCDLPQKMDPQ